MKLLLTATIMLAMYTNCYCQNYGAETELIKRTIERTKTIQQDYRVVERTFSEYLIKGDTTIGNHWFPYYFSSSKAYRISGLSPSEYVSVLKIDVYKFDANKKLQLIGSTQNASNDVYVKFNPPESGDYYIIVGGTLKENAESAFFSIIIDRQ